MSDEWRSYVVMGGLHGQFKGTVGRMERQGSIGDFFIFGYIFLFFEVSFSSP